MLPAILVLSLLAEPPPAPPAARVPDASWMGAYDLDGDGRRDLIVDEFTGGAHCCYRIGAELSSNKARVKLPFLLDGGYPMGLDLSQPHRFAIRTPAGALPELVMEIETYNGRPRPLRPAWKRRYGIRTHRIAVCFAGGKVRVRDYLPALAPCLKPAAPAGRTPPAKERDR
jgi:hypothetical protein